MSNGNGTYGEKQCSVISF